MELIRDTFSHVPPFVLFLGGFASVVALGLVRLSIMLQGVIS